MYAASLLQDPTRAHYIARDLGFHPEWHQKIKFSRAQWSAFTYAEAAELARCGTGRHKVYRIPQAYASGFASSKPRELYVLFARAPKHRLVTCGDWYGLLDWPLQPL